MCKSVLFCFSYNDYRELEWAMPLIVSLQLKNYRIVAILPEVATTSRQKVMLDWLHDYSVDVFYPHELVYGRSTVLTKLTLRYGKNHPLISTLIRLHSPGNKLVRFFKLEQSHKRKVFNRIEKQFGELECVFFPEGNSTSFNNSWIWPYYIFQYAKSKNKPVIGFVMSYIREISGIYEKNKDLDILLVISQSHKEVCDSNGLQARFTGAQRFNKEWVKEMHAYFKEKCYSDIPSSDNVALVLLKNSAGLMSGFLDDAEVIKLRKYLFAELIKRGFYLLIKPHPAESPDRLRESVEGLKDDDFLLSELPATYLATLSNCGILELPSNSAMDVLAAGKPAFWPKELYVNNMSRGDEYYNHLTQMELLSDFFNLVEHKLPHAKKDIEVDPSIYSKFIALSNANVDINVLTNEIKSGLSV